MSQARDVRRELPSVDRLLGSPAGRALVGRYRREHVVRQCRAILDEIRAAVAQSADVTHPATDDASILSTLGARLASASVPRLARVVNATGTVLHTNLGRALLPRAAIEAAALAAGNPVNLEYDLDRGGRGRREEAVERLLVELTGAEAATVVNNNAGAVLLVLNTLAEGREVIVSRGELIEIGGAFRIPAIMAKSGAVLREVGTTNRTHAADYEQAITDATAALLKVHTSNFRVVGFSAAVELGELVRIGRARGLPVVEDLGSGALVDLSRYGLPKEPVVSERIVLGADLVLFSGDKLLGGPQAGLIVGSRRWIAEIARNPLHRALRCREADDCRPRGHAQDLPAGHRRRRRDPDIEGAESQGRRHRIGRTAGLAASPARAGAGLLVVPRSVGCRGRERRAADRGASVNGHRRRAGRDGRRRDRRALSRGPPLHHRTRPRRPLPPRPARHRGPGGPRPGLARRRVMTPVIGTAGHIDHGKTALVRALTGQDTDRLKEEKERGISIDLGFAYLELPNGERAGIVDVPGHERFIRNMLAGAHGIDLVLFTVAADDGVMPQTEEHLDIVHLLGVRHAIFVITKIDLVPPERLKAVEEEIEILIAGTSVDHSPIRHCSSVTGQGLDELRRDILDIVERIGTSPPREGYFRLPVDRAFVLQGHGLVVTGTALSGTVAVGDRVRCLPGGQLLRVRSLQVHHQPGTSGSSGQRLALNLAGQDRVPIVRGDVICDEQLTEASDRFDAFVEAGSSAGVRIRNHQRVRVHLGTAERMGRLVLLGRKDVIRAKQAAYCQLELAEPLSTLRGDRFIVREETAQRTIGGGVVVNAWARKHDKRQAGLLRVLETLHRGRFDEAVETLVESSQDFALPLRALSLFANRPEADIRLEVERMSSIVCLRHDADLLCTTVAKWGRAREALVEALGAFHAAQPLAVGMDLEAARDRLDGFRDQLAFRLFIEGLVAERVIVREGSVLRLPQHAVVPDSQDAALIERVEQLLKATPLSPPDLKQLEQDARVSRERLIEVLKLMERNHVVVRVAADLYFFAEALDSVVRTLRERLAGNGAVTPADFRDLFATSRKYAIPILEHLDRTGVTVRVGDRRRLR